MSRIPRINRLKSTLCVPWNQDLEKCRNWFLGISMKNVLVQFRKWYLILRPRKCQKHECRRYHRFTPLFPWKFEFRKCRNRFLGIFMKNVIPRQYNFEDDILLRGRENLQNMNVRDTQFLPFKIKICKTLSQDTSTHQCRHILKISCL